MRKELAALSMILLAGCATSPKTKFYTLSVTPSGSQHQMKIPFPVQLAAVHIPPLLDRERMVRATGTNRVVISETERWSAPFDEMVRNVLARDLAALLPDGSVILPRAPAPAGIGTLVVTIVQFGPDATDEVKLSCSWALLQGDTETPVLERDFHFDAGPAATTDATVEAMSRCLERLASDIVSTLSNTSISISNPSSHRHRGQD